MTLATFLSNYKCEFSNNQIDHETIMALTKVIRRQDNLLVDRVKTMIDIHETRDTLEASQTAYSITPWDWNKYLDQVKRYHLDYIVLRAPIDDCLPLNTSTNIAPFYV